MNIPERNGHGEWKLFVFIVPIGILLIMIVGQIAVRIVPVWSVNAGMNSNLDPDSEAARPFSLLQPIIPQVLTPMAWADNYLTPMGDVSFPPFIIIEPTATASPSPTPVSPSPTDPLPTAPVTGTATPSVTPTESPTYVPPTKPTDENTDTPEPPATCQDPTANNYGDPLPCTYPPPTTCQDPTASNFGGPLPCTYPPTTCQDPTASNFGGPLPCTYPTPTGTPATVPTTYAEVTPPPQVGVGTLPDDSIGDLADGTYIIISLSVVVEPTPDSNYDLVFYEFDNGGSIYLDWIIIGISNDTDDSDGIQYYEVFNWGNGTPDSNSNVGDVAQSTGTEDDNQQIDTSEFHDPDDAGPAPQSGILIDVDQAPSSPPPDTYNYVVIISPTGGVTPAQDAQVDAVQAVEVPTPTP